MADQLQPGEYVTFVRQGGIPVRLVRFSSVYVRVTPSGGRLVTLDKYGGIPISVNDERLLPEEIKEQIGY
jgi:hypothetical protein